MTVETTSPDTPYTEQKPVQFTTRFLFLVTFLVALTLGLTRMFGPYGALLSGLILVFVVLGRFYTWFEALVVVAILSLLTTIIIPAFQYPRGISDRADCMNNLKQIALALHNYHDAYGSFPPAYIADKNGKPMHSWRVLILPFLERGNLYDQYDFNEPWNGPNNSKLANGMPYCYQCLSDPASGASLTTNYVAIVGPGTAWPGDKSRKLAEISDGGGDTIFLVEIVNSKVHWMEPRDLPVELITAEVNPKSKRGISSYHKPGVNAAMADGSVLHLPNGTSAATVRAMATVSGGETIRWRSDDRPEVVRDN